MAGGSYGRSASLSDSLTIALLIRSFAPRETRPSGPILVLRTFGRRGGGTMVHIPRRPEICQRATLDPKPPPPATESPRRFHKRMSPQTAEAATQRDPPGAWWVYVTALLTGSPRVR